MSFASIPRYMMPTKISATPTLAGGGTTFDINGVGEWVAVIFAMPETATISGYYFRVHSATQGCNAIVTLENVTDGVPSGVTNAFATSAITIDTSPSTRDYSGSFTSPFVVNQGTILAFKIAYTTGGSVPSSVSIGVLSDDNAGSGLPYCLEFDTSLQAPNDGISPNFCLLKSDNTAVQIKHCWPINVATTETFSSSANPTSIGNSLTVNAPCQISGASIWLDADANGTLKLYGGSAGETLLASTSVSINLPNSAAMFMVDYYFSAPVDLSPGTTYYLVVEAVSGTLGIATMTFANANYRSGSPLGGDSLTYATRTSGGVWSTTSTKQTFIAPILTAFDTGGNVIGGETSHVFIG